MRAGVFDSGVGGLTVVKSLLEHKLFSEIIYFGDTARVPYGVKDQNTIIRYSLEALEFFKNFEIDIFITACNTVSAYALDELRAQADCDVIGVVEAGALALENAVEDKDASILVLGTKATISSRAYEALLEQKNYKNFTSIAPSLFVPIVEDKIYEGEVLNAAFKHYFKDIKSHDAIILGCTHYPLISTAIAKYFNHESKVIHSGEAIVEYLQKEHHFNKKHKKTKLKFFASENPDALKQVAHDWLELS